MSLEVKRGNKRLEPVSLADNQVLSLTGPGFMIDCLEGLVWVTWPGGHDRIVIPGSPFKIKARGRICVQAMVDSVVRIEGHGWWLGWALRLGKRLWSAWPRPRESAWQRGLGAYSAKTWPFFRV